MFTLPNLLSLSRFPLALAFCYESPALRFLAVVLAMITDGLDGYYARKQKSTSRIGAILDPMSDKFFVFFALWVLVAEHKLQMWKVAAMLCRDIALIIFGFYLVFKGRLFSYRHKAIWCGKLVTALQLVVLLGLIAGFTIPTSLFTVFILLGCFALVELYQSRHQLARPSAYE